MNINGIPDTRGNTRDPNGYLVIGYPAGCDRVCDRMWPDVNLLNVELGLPIPVPYLSHWYPYFQGYQCRGALFWRTQRLRLVEGPWVWSHDLLCILEKSLHPFANWTTHLMAFHFLFTVKLCVLLTQCIAQAHYMEVDYFANLS